MTSKFMGLAVLGLGVIVSACAPATGNTPSGNNEATRGTPKRVVAAIMADPPYVVQVLNPGSHWRGIEHIQALVAGGLTRTGDGNRFAELAEASPTAENGLWKVHGDGTMETTWQLKNGVQWHDGAAVTSPALVFTMQVVT